MRVLALATVIALAASATTASATTDRAAFRKTAFAAVAQIQPRLDACYLGENLTIAISFDVQVTIMGDDKGNIITIQETDTFGSTVAFRNCVAASFKRLDIPRLASGEVESFIKRFRMRSQ